VDSSRRAVAHDPTSRILSEDLRVWASSEGDRTVGTLIEAFADKSFAILFVFLLGVPALPLPTGGVTHLFEAIAMLLALQLLIGRKSVWLPRRWRSVTLAGDKRERFVERLLALTAWLERRSQPRGRYLFGSRAGRVLFGAFALVGTVAAFVAPPFSMLDTLPALGVVVLSVGVLLEDAVIAGAGVAIGAGGIALVLALGRAALHGLENLI
jgi:hypothetical protein